MPEKLYCPRCSTQFKSETSYCRTCGLSLSGVSEIVLGDTVNAPVTTNQPNPRIIRVGIGLFILGTVLGLANVIVRDLALFPEIYGKVIFLAFIIAGLSCLGSSFLFPRTTYTKRKRPVTDNDFESQLATNPLPDQLSPATINDIGMNISSARESVVAKIGSVTEHTTRQLRSGDRSD